MGNKSLATNNPTSMKKNEGVAKTTQGITARAYFITN